MGSTFRVNYKIAKLRKIRATMSYKQIYGVVGQGSPDWQWYRRANKHAQEVCNFAGRALSSMTLEAVGADTFEQPHVQLAIKVVAVQWARDLNLPWDPYDMPGYCHFPKVWS